MPQSTASSNNVRGFGWVRDLPDLRDYRFSRPVTAPKKLPGFVDLSAKMPPPVYDQGSLGSCVMNACCKGFDVELVRKIKPPLLPSRLFGYYNARALEGTIHSDSGCTIRDGIKTMLKQGLCREKEWPYNITKFTARPSTNCYRSALDHQLLQYLSVSQTQAALCSCLAAGYPVIFGFMVYESFMSETVAKTGNAPFPKGNERDYGGHAVLMVGYNNTGKAKRFNGSFSWPNKTFLVLNSWSEDWGMRGYFTLPFDYVLDRDLADSFWSLRLVEE